MRDSLAAVGGELLIASEPGVGTTVSGTIPLRRAAERDHPLRMMYRAPGLRFSAGGAWT